ncbi:MFS transporter [Halorubellus litoreus]|uniref:MFS transporter n=1 Tax=Halorubellus litoreus TaxID=755308 RepID=A0ABD5VG85_9EURY
MRSLLSNRNFTRLFAGRLVTNAGDSLYFIAAMWLVYDLTGNEFYSGLAGFLTMAPQALQAFSGPLVDRWNVKHLLVATQLVQAVLILAIPIAAWTGNLTVWVVLTVMPLLSLLNQFVYPAQSALLPRIVDDDELVAANSAFSMAYQGVDAAFNAVSGLLVAVVGATVIFLLDSATFVAAALLFATLALPDRDAADVETGDAATEGDADADAGAVATDGGDADPHSSAADDADADASLGYLESLREGAAFVRGSVLFPMLAGSLVINFTFGAAIAVLPSYGDVVGAASGPLAGVLGGSVGGASAYGLLMAALGGGMFVGALAANAVSDRAFGRLAVVTMAVGGVAWLAAVYASTPAATVPLFALALVPAGITNVLIVSMIQSLVPDALLGRVMGVVGSVSAFATPFGALAGGAVAAAYGPTVVMYAGGVGLLFLAAYNLAVPSIRRLPAVGDVETLST